MAGWRLWAVAVLLGVMASTVPTNSQTDCRPGGCPALVPPEVGSDPVLCFKCGSNAPRDLYLFTAAPRPPTTLMASVPSVLTLDFLLFKLPGGPKSLGSIQVRVLDVVVDGNASLVEVDRKDNKAPSFLTAAVAESKPSGMDTEQIIVLEVYELDNSSENVLGHLNVTFSVFPRIFTTGSRITQWVGRTFRIDAPFVSGGRPPYTFLASNSAGAPNKVSVRKDGRLSAKATKEGGQTTQHLVMDQNGVSTLLATYFFEAWHPLGGQIVVGNQEIAGEDEDDDFEDDDDDDNENVEKVTFKTTMTPNEPYSLNFEYIACFGSVEEAILMCEDVELQFFVFELDDFTCTEAMVRQLNASVIKGCHVSQSAFLYNVTINGTAPDVIFSDKVKFELVIADSVDFLSLGAIDVKVLTVDDEEDPDTDSKKREGSPPTLAPPQQSSDSASRTLLSAVIPSILGALLSAAIIFVIRERRRRRRGKALEVFSKFPELRNWDRKKKDVTFVKKLGSGAFGVVHLAEAHHIRHWRGSIPKNASDGSGKTLVAVKLMEESDDTSFRDVREFLSEADLMRQFAKLAPTNVVSLYGVCLSEGHPYYVIMEYCSRGDLHNVLADARPTADSIDAQGQRIAGRKAGFGMDQLLKFGEDTCTGIAFLHEQGIVHRDLAARNCLVTEQLDVKIADFGLSRDLTEQDSEYYRLQRTARLPVRWMAPESLNGGKYSAKSDIFSLGIVLYEIITFGGMPHPTKTNDEVYHMALVGTYMDCPVECPAALYAIMAMCWGFQPSSRPDGAYVKAALRHLRDPRSFPAPPPMAAPVPPSMDEGVIMEASSIPVTMGGDAEEVFEENTAAFELHPNAPSRDTYIQIDRMEAADPYLTVMGADDDGAKASYVPLGAGSPPATVQYRVLIASDGQGYVPIDPAVAPGASPLYKLVESPQGRGLVPAEATTAAGSPLYKPLADDEAIDPSYNPLPSGAGRGAPPVVYTPLGANGRDDGYVLKSAQGNPVLYKPLDYQPAELRGVSPASGYVRVAEQPSEGAKKMYLPIVSSGERQSIPEPLFVNHGVGRTLSTHVAKEVEVPALV